MAWLLLLWQVYLPPSQLWTGPYQGSGPSFLPLAPVQTPVEESTCGSKSEKGRHGTISIGPSTVGEKEVGWVLHSFRNLLSRALARSV
jgi:hypothetical protein